VRRLREDASCGAAAADPPSLLAVNVHDCAYLRLLSWDHASDPFPEVNVKAGRCVLACHLYVFKKIFSLKLLFPVALSTDGVDGSGPVPGDALGGGAAGRALLRAAHRLHHHGGGDLGPPGADGDAQGRRQRHARGHARTVSSGHGRGGTFERFQKDYAFIVIILFTHIISDHFDSSGNIFPVEQYPVNRKSRFRKVLTLSFMNRFFKRNVMMKSSLIVLRSCL